MQRVPYMIHIPGQTNGGINHTYGGQVDALPTLLHLLGIDTQKYIQLGQDLFSEEHEELVAFRDGSFMTPDYTFYGGVLYDNTTGEIAEELSEDEQAKIDGYQERVNRQLGVSDQINNGDLLRFYTGSGLEPIDPESFNYKDSLTRLVSLEQALGNDSTSLYSQHKQQSTVELYQSKSYQEYVAPNEAQDTEVTPSSEVVAPAK